jgi:anthranilate phosphoribosyltransferase
MEALGINIQMPVELLRKAVKDVGLGFLFAQRFHRSMKHVMPARVQLKVPTVFNIIGPLANPALPHFQVVGVSSPEVLELVAQALVGLQTKHAMVVHSHEGLDEISISGPTRIIEVKDGNIHRSVISPEIFGVTPRALETVRGGDARTNASIVEGILRGEKGPRRDIVLANAAAALMVAGVAGSLGEGFTQAVKSVDSGAALGKLRLLREISG